MSDIETEYICALCSANFADQQKIASSGIESSMFLSRNAEANYLFAYMEKYKKFPSLKIFRLQFPSFPVLRVSEPVSFYADRLIERAVYGNLQKVLSKVTKQLKDTGLGAVHDCVKEMAKAQDLLRYGYSSDIAWDKWDAYANYASREVAGTLWVTPYRLLNSMIRGVRAKQLVTIAARPAMGKCVAQGTVVLDPISGEWLPVEQVIKKRSEVLSWTGASFEKQSPIAWVHTGRKECLCINHRVGEPLEVTPEHPLLTSSGWKAAEDIRDGERIAVLRKAPRPERIKDVPEAEAVFLAIILSEGSISGHHIGFSSGSIAFIKRASRCANALGMRIVRRSKYDYDFINKVASKYNTHPSIARELLKKYGLKDEKAVNKFIPREVFSFSCKLLAKFISVFWEGDGYVADKNVLGIGLSSERLLDDLRRLMLRFGVVACKYKKRTKCGKKMFNSWHLFIIGSSRCEAKKMLRFVKGRKGLKIRRLRSIVQNNVDVIDLPDWAKQRIQEERKKGTVRFSRMPRPKGVKHKLVFRDFCGKHGGNKVTRNRLRLLLDNCEKSLEDLRYFVSEQLIWSEVTSKERVGIKEVYDFTVPVHHNFVANGVVCHNTWLLLYIALGFWEQGANVLFVEKEMGREEIYERADALYFDLDWIKFLGGKLSRHEMRKHENNRKSMFAKRQNKFVVSDSEDLNSNGIDSILAKIIEHQPDIVCIDGAYLLEEAEGRTVFEKAAAVSRSTKRLARNRNLPIVQTIQMNREAEKTGGGLATLALSDAFGQDADYVLAIKGKKEESVREIELLKGRTIMGGVHSFFINAIFSPRVDLTELGTVNNNQVVEVDTIDG